jgi:heptosyltransferase-3
VAEAAVPAPRRIVVINVTRIGDTLLATPAIRALAKAWPQAQLTVFGHPKRVEVLQHLPFVEMIGSITKHRARWRGWLGMQRWNLALVYGFDRALVAYALRVADKVVAFRQGDERIDARLFRVVEHPPAHAMHAVRLPLLLVQALGVPPDGLRLSYVVTPREKAWAREFLGALRAPGEAPLVGLQIAGFHATRYRDWPLESFAELAQRIVGRWPRARLLFFGGEAERERTAALCARLPRHASNLAGRLSLRESAALMDALDLYVGVDTGPTHIIGALEPPMVALYHCHSPGSQIGPLERPRCHVVEHPHPAPCGPEVPMAGLPVDVVWNCVVEALG